MPIRELDPRLYGIAPVEADAHDGQVLWTAEGVMKYLGISETTLRLSSDLMRLRRVIAPRTYRWIPDEVRAYVAALPKGPVPLTVQKALSVDRQRVKKARQTREHRKTMQREFARKLQQMPTEGL